MDFSKISTEALRHELRLRQARSIASMRRYLVASSDLSEIGVESDERSDEDSIFVRAQHSSYTSTGFPKSLGNETAFRSPFGFGSTAERHKPSIRQSKKLPHSSAGCNRTDLLEASVPRKRRRSQSCEMVESDDGFRSYFSASRAIAYQAAAISRVKHAKREETVAQQQKDDRRLAERLAAEEEDDILMLMEGQWRRARLGTKCRPIDLDQSFIRHNPQSSALGGFFGDHANDRSFYDKSFSKPSMRRQSETCNAAIARQIQKEEVQSQEARSRAAASQTRDCAVCGDATLVADLPSLSLCTHNADVCADCYTAWLSSQLQENGWQEVICPGSTCKVKLTYDEIKAYASKETFERYDVIQARNVLSADPNFRWCKTPGCGSGQIHDMDEFGSKFVCVECHARFCVKHEVPYHDDESCAQYEYHTSGQKDRDERRKEDQASETAVGQLTKKCPGSGCARPIEKNGGCVHMTCSQCKHEFCWVCLERWASRECRHSA